MIGSRSLTVDSEEHVGEARRITRISVLVSVFLVAVVGSGCGVAKAPERRDASDVAVAKNVERLDEIKGQVDGIDRRFQETNEPRPTTRAQLESVVDEWRRFPAEYDSLLRRAENLRSDTAALPVREVQEMWAVLVEGLRLRSDGTRETVRLFDGVLREEVDPQTAGARLDELSEELNRVNARFSSLAEKYNAGATQR